MKQTILAFSAIALVAAAAHAQSGNRVIPGIPPKGPKSKLSPVVNVPPPAPLPPSSDTCASPDVITGTGQFPFDNSIATTGPEGQLEGPCSYYGQTDILFDVWFKWTATQSGIATVNTCGVATVDTKIAIYNGAACPTGTTIACVDDSCVGYQTTVQFPCTMGNDYVIQLGCYPGAFPPAVPGAGMFDLTVSTAQPNDDCSTPTVVVGTGPFPLDTTAATTGTQGQAEALCNFYGLPPISKDLWFQWTATFSGNAGVRTCNQTGADSKIAVYGGAGCPASGSAIACNDDNCATLQSEAQFPCVLGQVYTFQIGSYGTVGSSVIGTFDIYQLPPAPSNDDCSTPQIVVGIGPFPFDNTYATTGTQGQAEAPCLFFGGTGLPKDLWYEWTATFTGLADARTCTQTGVDTKIAAYAGSGCPAAGSSIACNDDSCASLQTECLFPCTIGNVYTLQLGLYYNTQTGGTGSWDIYIPPPPPSNDDCSTPIALPGAGTYAFDTTSASTGTQGQAEASCLFFATTGIANDLWYTWTATSSGTATFSTCGGTTAGVSDDSKIAVYQGNGCPVSAAITCLDDDGAACAAAGLNTTVSWATTCGTTYTIQLGRYPGAGAVAGTFTFSETGTPCVSGVGYCFGDGTGTACPCAAAAPPGGTGPTGPGAAGNGCPNSLNAAGANLTASGAASVSADTLVLQGSGMPNSSALYFQGTLKINTGSGSVFGDGLRCVGGSVIRLKTVTNVAGASSYPTGGDPSVSVKGLVPGTGGTRYYQIWYRNSALFCVATSTFNLSNGFDVTWVP